MDTTEQDKTANRGLPIGWLAAVLLVLLVWAGAFALRSGGEKEIIPGWADGMPAGQQLAQETGKPMVVLFTASWCGYCQVLKKDVLTQPDVAAALQARFVPVQIDMSDRSTSNPNNELVMHYGIQGYPTVLMMTPTGKTVEMYRGNGTVQNFTSWLARLAP